MGTNSRKRRTQCYFILLKIKFVDVNMLIMSSKWIKCMTIGVTMTRV